jgi:hypothetical protein
MIRVYLASISYLSHRHHLTPSQPHKMDLTGTVALCIAILIILIIQFSIIAALAAYLLVRQPSSHLDHEARKTEVLRNQVASPPQDRAGIKRSLPATHDQRSHHQIDDSSSMYSNPEPLIPEAARDVGRVGR